MNKEMMKHRLDLLGIEYVDPGISDRFGVIDLAVGCDFWEYERGDACFSKISSTWNEFLHRYVVNNGIIERVRDEVTTIEYENEFNKLLLSGKYGLLELYMKIVEGGNILKTKEGNFNKILREHIIGLLNAVVKVKIETLSCILHHDMVIITVIGKDDTVGTVVIDKYSNIYWGNGIRVYSGFWGSKLSSYGLGFNHCDLIFEDGEKDGKGRVMIIDSDGSKKENVFIELDISNLIEVY